MTMYSLHRIAESIARIGHHVTSGRKISLNPISIDNVRLNLWLNSPNLVTRPTDWSRLNVSAWPALGLLGWWCFSVSSIARWWFVPLWECRRLPHPSVDPWSGHWRTRSSGSPRVSQVQCRRSWPHRLDPVADDLGYELRSIVWSDVGRNTHRMNRAVRASITSVELNFRLTRIARHSRVNTSMRLSVLKALLSSVGLQLLQPVKYSLQ